jgi:hypothetical protein
MLLDICWCVRSMLESAAAPPGNPPGDAMVLGGTVVLQRVVPRK